MFRFFMLLKRHWTLNFRERFTLWTTKASTLNLFFLTILENSQKKYNYSPNFSKWHTGLSKIPYEYIFLLTSYERPTSMMFIDPSIFSSFLLCLFCVLLTTNMAIMIRRSVIRCILGVSFFLLSLHISELRINLFNYQRPFVVLSSRLHFSFNYVYVLKKTWIYI